MSHFDSYSDLALESLVRFASERPPHRLIRFPDVFSRICPLLSIEKPEAWTVLRALENQGRIEIVPFHWKVDRYRNGQVLPKTEVLQTVLKIIVYEHVDEY